VAGWGKKLAAVSAAGGPGPTLAGSHLRDNPFYAASPAGRGGVVAAAGCQPVPGFCLHIRSKSPITRASHPTPQFLIFMNIRHFVSASSLVLAGWLLMTFLREVPTDPYPALGRGSVPIPSEGPTSQRVEPAGGGESAPVLSLLREADEVFGAP
jgi:hypothetical protein